MRKKVAASKTDFVQEDDSLGSITLKLFLFFSIGVSSYSQTHIQAHRAGLNVYERL